MQKLLILPAVLCVFNFVFAQENSTQCSKRSRYSNIQAKSNSLSVEQIAETEKYNVHFYDLNLAMDNTSKNVSGTVGIHGTANEILDSVLIELFEDYTITNITLNSISTPYSRVASAIKIPVNLFAVDFKKRRRQITDKIRGDQ